MVKNMNVLILADYRTPKSGNFIASILDLGIAMREEGNKIVYVFPKNEESGYTWCKWIEENNFDVILFDDAQLENIKLQKLRKIVKLILFIHILDIYIGYYCSSIN